MLASTKLSAVTCMAAPYITSRLWALKGIREKEWVTDKESSMQPLS